MDDALLQWVLQDVSARLGFEEHTEGNTFSFEGRYDEYW